jgi:transcriptional regulator with GAF, ATPase, and Fis domain
MRKLMNYEWPGNIRELKNVVQRLLFFDEKIINSSIIENALGKKIFDTDLMDYSDGISFKDADGITSLKSMERQFREKYFKYIRSQCASDAEAAKKLGLAPPNYSRMCKELGLK